MKEDREEEEEELEDLLEWGEEEEIIGLEEETEEEKVTPMEEEIELAEIDIEQLFKKPKKKKKIKPILVIKVALLVWLFSSGVISLIAMSSEKSLDVEMNTAFQKLSTALDSLENMNLDQCRSYFIESATMFDKLIKRHSTTANLQNVNIFYLIAVNLFSDIRSSQKYRDKIFRIAYHISLSGIHAVDVIHNLKLGVTSYENQVIAGNYFQLLQGNYTLFNSEVDKARDVAKTVGYDADTITKETLAKLLTSMENLTVLLNEYYILSKYLKVVIDSMTKVSEAINYYKNGDIQGSNNALNEAEELINRINKTTAKYTYISDYITIINAIKYYLTESVNSLREGDSDASERFLNYAEREFQIIYTNLSS